MLQALSWVILLLALARGAWLAFAPERYRDDRRRRWETRATHALGLSHARQYPRARPVPGADPVPGGAVVSASRSR